MEHESIIYNPINDITAEYMSSVISMSAAIEFAGTYKNNKNYDNGTMIIDDGKFYIKSYGGWVEITRSSI